MTLTSHIHSCFEHQLLLKSDFYCTQDFEWLISKVEQKLLPCFSLVVAQSQVALKTSHYLTVLVLPSGMLFEILPKVDNCTNYPSKTSKDIAEDTANANIKKSTDTASCKQLSRTQELANTRLWLKNMLDDLFLLRINHKNVHLLAQSNSITNENFNDGYTWLHPIISAWINAVERFELVQQYHYEHSNHPQAQGKLLIKQQLKHNSLKPHYRYTNEQKFQHNPLWSQVFYTVMLKLNELGFTYPKNLRYKILSMQLPNNEQLTPLANHQLQQSLNLLLNLLAGKSEMDSLNVEYGKLALHLSQLILQVHDMGLPISGDNYVPAVLIDMNVAFEKWVSYKLAIKYKRSLISTQQHYHWLTGTSNKDNQKNEESSYVNSFEKTVRKIQPDLLILDEKNQVEVVVDIKYKQINTPQQISSVDLYQIFSYLTHFDAKQAWLIFPKSQNFQHSYEFSLKNNLNLTTCSIMILPFDFNIGEVVF